MQPRYTPAMRVRSALVKVVAGLTVTVFLLSGLAYMTLRAADAGSECTAAEEDLIPTLAAQKILAAHPDNAVARDSHTGCFQDDPFPYAGKFYEFPSHRQNYTSFYEAAAKGDGWRPVAVEDSPDDICFTKKIGDATAFLSVGGHSIDGVSGYDISISASYDEVPEDGGLMC